jgi:hypothetical protein
MQEGSVFYRRQHLFTISGKLPDLSDYIIAGCRYGGPIGVFEPYIPRLQLTMYYQLLCVILPRL